jgi:F-type H+-transporting ATPase subunit epsilon
MKNKFMSLRILLPYKIFAEFKGITSIVAETNKGMFGLLPNRLDCIAVLIPGILSYETERGKKKYCALDEGILIKTEAEVTISVHNAIGPADLGELRNQMETFFRNLNEEEQQMRYTMTKLEANFIQQFEKLHKESQ